ncbi:hypothetical protein BKN37_06280 [Mycobacterium talmoniae]|uniref:Orc1-like AAA ATPase domain-containing protein n=1 Tax=Mycobacterium talmoniae TaxID=1858794 RepID=A0A1S1NMB4_9MYCO|nr:hypothetical protein BKN37_06280 [Mycobacterium talmoniae]
MVIGSQCDALGESSKLSFLPDLAAELYEVLIDPHLGACEPALPRRHCGGLLLDPTHNAALNALHNAFAWANKDGALLFVAVLGHGMVKYGDFFFLSRDSSGTGDYRRDVFLSHALKHLLGDCGDLNGLIVWVDSCHSGVAAQQAATEWGQVGLGQAARRYELLSAADDRPAYRGDFTRALISTLRHGIAGAGETIDARDLREPLKMGAKAQRPQRVTIDGGQWAARGDQGLWLSRNHALYSAQDNTASVAAQARVGELTDYLQPTETLDALVAAAKVHDCVMLTGPRGTGKSTLAAALAQPSVTDGRVPDGFVNAIIFATPLSTMNTLSSALAGGLRRTVKGFSQAVNAFDERLDPAERESLPALERQVMGPLRLIKRRRPVRLVIDALDELPKATERALRKAVTDARVRRNGESGSAGVSFVLTARPGAAPLAGACRIAVTPPGDAAIGAYLRRREIPDDHIPALVDRAGGNWLHAYLLAEQAVRPGFDPGQLPVDLAPSLAELYTTELAAAGAEDRERWETQLRPVLAVCAVAGVGPVLPLPLAVAAAARLGGPNTPSRFRDSVVRLSGLIVRAKPGQPEEQVGIFHLSLRDDYLLKPDLGVQFTIDGPEAHGALAEALAELAPVQQHDPENPLHNYAMRAEAEHLWACGDTADVVKSLTWRPLERAVDEVERWQRWKARLDDRLKPEDPAVLTARSYLAYYTGTAGDPAAARDQYSNLLPLRRKVSGLTHRDTWSDLVALARFTGEAGDPVAARDQYSDLLPAIEKDYEPTDPLALLARANLAYFTGEAGDPIAARNQYARLLEIRQEVFEPTHPSIFTTRMNLAYFTGEAGEPLVARDAFAELLEILKHDSRPARSHTLTVRAHLARFTGEAGDPVGARDQFKALLPTLEEVWGPDHPDTLTARAHLARFIGEAGAPAEARDRFAVLVEIRKKVSKPRHPDTLCARANLARFTGEAGDPIAARNQLKALLPTMLKVLGDRHPDTLTARAHLARFTREPDRPGRRPQPVRRAARHHRGGRATQAPRSLC